MTAFLNIRQVNLRYKKEFHDALDQVLESGWLILGQKTKEFEISFAEYCGVAHCVGVANGLDALHLALRAWGIGIGDEVIVPSNTYIATWLAVTQTGATPVPVEPELSTYNIDPDAILEAITPRTKAIIPVHLYGQTAKMPEIMKIAQNRGIHVLEDAAQAHGASCNGAKAGSMGDAAAFSFYPGKNLGALGDGGGITSNSDFLIDKVRTLRNYGSNIKYHNEILGYNSRLDELQSAFLSVKLKHLDEDNQRRSLIAKTYLDALSKNDGLVLPFTQEGNVHAWHLFVIRHPERDELQKRLTENGIGTLIHYPIPPHIQPAYATLNLPKGKFPLSEMIHQQVLSLPMDPTMTLNEARQVCEVVNETLKTL